MSGHIMQTRLSIETVHESRLAELEMIIVTSK